VQKPHRVGSNDVLQVIGRVIVYHENLVPISRIVKLLDRVEHMADDVSPVVDGYYDRDIR